MIASFLHLLVQLLLITGFSAHTDPRTYTTTVTWDQNRPAYLCLYDKELISCGVYGQGIHVIELGNVAPVGLRVHTADTLTVKEVGNGNAQAAAAVTSMYTIRFPLMVR